MAKLDVSTVGIDGGNQPRRVAASATRYYAGEPMNSLMTHSSGAANVNTIVVLTDTKPRVATDSFQGIAAMDGTVNSAGTIVAHKTYVAVPIAEVTRIRAVAKTVANVDTDAELLLILGDFLDFDLTTAKYTWDDVAASNLSTFKCVDGNTAKSTLDCVIAPVGLRSTNDPTFT